MCLRSRSFAYFCAVFAALGLACVPAHGIVYTEAFDTGLGSWKKPPLSGTGTTTWDAASQRLKISAFGVSSSQAHNIVDTFTLENPGDQITFEIELEFTGDPALWNFALYDSGEVWGAGFRLNQTGAVNETVGGSGSWVFSEGVPLTGTVYTARVILDYDGVNVNRTYHLNSDVYAGTSEIFSGPETYHGYIGAATLTSMDSYFDNVQIELVPEPSSSVLILLAALGLALRRPRPRRA